MIPSLHFEPHSVEGSLEQMNRAVVGIDDELAIRPLGVFVNADQKLQGKRCLEAVNESDRRRLE